MDPLVVALGLLAASTAGELVLDARQLACINAQATEAAKDDRFAYQGARLRLAGVGKVAHALVNTWVLWSELIPAAWGWCVATLPSAPLVLAIALVTLSSAAMDLPLAVAGALIEQRFGFFRGTWALFAADQAKSLALTLAIGTPIALALEALIVATEESLLQLVLGVWACLVVLMLVMMLAYPRVIAPCFNTFTPLDEGSPLYAGIRDLAAKAQYPLADVMVMDGSTRSSHSNAYLYGFGPAKRVVLYDTLIEQMGGTKDGGGQAPGVLAVLAHEMGHYSCSHTIKGMVASQLYLGAYLVGFAFVHGSQDLAPAFGFTDGVPAPPALMSLVLFSLFAGPGDVVATLLLHAMSRRFEFEADAYAVELDDGAALIHALCVLQEENKGIDDPDPWYSLYHHTHPPIPQRVRAIRAAMSAKSKDL